MSYTRKVCSFWDRRRRWQKGQWSGVRERTSGPGGTGTSRRRTPGRRGRLSSHWKRTSRCSHFLWTKLKLAREARCNANMWIAEELLRETLRDHAHDHAVVAQISGVLREWR